MNRTLLTVSLLLVVGVALVSASGNDDGARGRSAYGKDHYDDDHDEHYHGAYGDMPTEEVELTGRLQLAENEQPTMVVGQREYRLLIAPVLAAEITVANNDQVTVEGFQIERPSPDLLGVDTIVYVEAITVDGERYQLPAATRRTRGRGRYRR